MSYGSKGLQDLADEAYANSKAKGFHDKPKSVGDDIALMHSELSEALEDFRAGHAPSKVWYEDGEGTRFESQFNPGSGPAGDPKKPCGIPSELADVIIRILDFSGKWNIAIEQAVREKMLFNATRPKMHGGKKL